MCSISGVSVVNIAHEMPAPMPAAVATKDNIDGCKKTRRDHRNTDRSSTGRAWPLNPVIAAGQPKRCGGGYGNSLVGFLSNVTAINRE